MSINITEQHIISSDHAECKLYLDEGKIDLELEKYDNLSVDQFNSVMDGINAFAEHVNNRIKNSDININCVQDCEISETTENIS